MLYIQVLILPKSYKYQDNTLNGPHDYITDAISSRYVMKKTNSRDRKKTHHKLDILTSDPLIFIVLICIWENVQVQKEKVQIKTKQETVDPDQLATDKILGAS